MINVMKKLNKLLYRLTKDTKMSLPSTTILITDHRFKFVFKSYNNFVYVIIMQIHFDFVIQCSISIYVHKNTYFFTIRQYIQC